MKILLRCAVALFIAAFPVWSSVAGLHLHGGGPLQFASALPLGGGGWLVEGDVADDGQIIAVTDTYGAWLRPAGGSSFTQIITCNSLPTANCGYFPRTGGPQINQEAGPPTALAACPQNSAIVYMLYNGFVFKSTDHAATFPLQTGFNGGQQAVQGSNGPYRFTGRKAACDPHNINHAYISTDATGLWETNDGGTTWAVVPSTSIPNSTGDFTIAITAASWSAGTVSFTLASHPNLSTNGSDFFQVQNMTPSAYNGRYVVTGLAGNVVTAALASNPGTATVLGLLNPNSGSGGDNASYPNYNIAFDASSGSASNCGPNSNNTCKIYVANYVNSSGTLSGKLFASLNGGTSWAAAGTGGPNTFGHLIVSPLDGVVWMTDRRTATDQGGVWKYSGGTAGTFTDYTASTGASQHSIAADRVTAGKLYASDVSGNVQTVTSNTTWGANFGHTQTATDIPWLAWTNDFGLSNGDSITDPTTNNLVLFAGIAVWSAPTSSFTSTFVWSSITKAIEQMDAQAVRPLPNGNVALGVQDRAIFVVTPGTYPLTQQTTYQNGVDLAVGSDVDFAKSDSTHMAAIMNPWGGTASFSGSSADSGATWKPFNSFYQTYPVSAIAFDGSNQWKISVSHADALALTNWTAGPPASGSIVRIIGIDAQGQPQGMKVGQAWPVSVDTVGNTVTLLGSNDGVNISKAASGSFMMYVDTNPLTNGNGRFNITNVTNNGSGLIRITVNSIAFIFGSQTKVCISGSFGVPNAIGCWVAVNVNANTPGTVDLYGSTFAGTYTSGGVMTGPVTGGGAIAQSTPNNIVLIPSDKAFPQCTTDGGLTWNELQIPASAIGYGNDTGWGFGHFLIRHEVTADPSAANTFYAYNDNGVSSGVYKIVNCTVQNSGNPASGSQLNSSVAGYTANTVATSPLLFLFGGDNGTFASVPGNTGHLFWASGPQGSPATNGPGSVPLYRSQDGAANWFAVPNVTNPISIGCGATAPGATYPTCFMPGWVDISDGNGGTYGIWRSKNANASIASFTGSITSNVLTASSVTGTIAVGTELFGANMTAAATVASLGTGTGGAGTYNLTTTPNAASGSMQTGPAWTKVETYPAGNQDQVYLIAADLNIWNRWYVGFGGSSFAYGQQN